MNIQKTIKNLGVALALSMLPVKAHSVSTDVRYIASEKGSDSYVEASALYQLPGKIEGFTYLDFLKDGKGYFGETSLDKSIVAGIGPMIRGVHLNDLLSQEGFGASASIGGKSGYAKAYVLPKWIDEKGKSIDSKAIAGYAFGLFLPKGIKVSGFGKYNYQKGEWDYGEMELGKTFKDFEISYNPALLSNGTKTPTVEQRVSMRVKF